jgi:hypothetical protein
LFSFLGRMSLSHTLVCLNFTWCLLHKALFFSVSSSLCCCILGTRFTHNLLRISAGNEDSFLFLELVYFGRRLCWSPHVVSLKAIESSNSKSLSFFFSQQKDFWERLLRKISPKTVFPFRLRL